MKRYLVRASVEYSVVIEADTPSMAEEEAEGIEWSAWDTEEYSPFETEEIESASL